jgi:hypothetical protein
MIHKIGIDPDVDKSGFAVSVDGKLTSVTTKSFWEIADYLFDHSKTSVVYIEAGWLHAKSNWHGRPGQSKAVGEKISKAVGANHQVGKLMAEYCERNGIEYHLVKPMGKVDAKTFKNTTKWQDRTNQEERDAAMIIFGR